MNNSIKFWENHAKDINGILIDLSGVLFNNIAAEGQDAVAIEGSIEGVQMLQKAHIPHLFCTNDSACTQDFLLRKLNHLGYNIPTKDFIYQPLPAMRNILIQKNLRPHLLVDDAVLSEFEEIDQNDPNCVVIADAGDKFTNKTLNEAFKVLLKYPLLYSLGHGRYYVRGDELVLDVGAYSVALEYAANVQPEIIGKPSKLYYDGAREILAKRFNVEVNSKILMIGDDISSDVGGSQNCGFFGVLVRTGKYRRETDEPHKLVKPDAVVDNLRTAVELYLKYRK